MKRCVALLLGAVLLAGAGCSAGAPGGEVGSGPGQVTWEVATGSAALAAAPGEKVGIEGWEALVTAHFSAPVKAERVRLTVEGGFWQAGSQPVQTDGARVTFRLWSELAGNDPVVLRLEAPVAATLTLQPRTPALTADEEEALAELGRRIWALAAAGDAASLRGLMAPAAHLTAPGGEFQAEGVGTGLEAVAAWAAKRAQGPEPRISIEPRRSYASMDLISIDTGRERLAAYVTIPGRRIAKMFGLSP